LYSTANDSLPLLTMSQGRTTFLPEFRREDDANSASGSNTTLRGSVAPPLHRTAWESEDAAGNALSPIRHKPSGNPQFQPSPKHTGKRAEAAHNPNQVCALRWSLLPISVCLRSSLIHDIELFRVEKMLA
jgi:hypothetical protein